MNKYSWVVLGILFSSLAQILLKKAAEYEIKTLLWATWVFISIIFYAIAFILYSMILKHFPISKISPVMTVGVMICVVSVGLIWGEKLSVSSFIGIMLGAASIYFILGAQ